MSTSSFWNEFNRGKTNARGARGTWDNPEVVTPAGDWVRQISRLARLMDSRYQVPGTNFRFGLDPLIGLIPGVGNLATSAVSLALIGTMLRHGASGNVAARMALNVLIDGLIGAIPVVGNVFDFVYRANDRNVELLRRHYDEGAYQGSGWGILAAVGAVLFVVAGATVWLAAKIIGGLLDLIF